MDPPDRFPTILPSSAFYQAQHSTRFFASRKETEKSTVGRRVKARKAVPGLKTRKRLSGSGPKPRKIVTGSRIRHVRSTGNKKLADAAARTKRLTAKLSSLKKGDEGLPIESIGSSMTHVLGSNPDPATVQRSSIVPGDLSLGVLDVQRGPIPNLSNGLDKVLFNPGVCHVRDPRTGVFNFDPYLEKIMPVQEFDFNTLTLFVSPSKDNLLAKIAAEAGQKYVASTSSMTGILKHFHYLLSRWRKPNFNMLSKSFPAPSVSFTRLNRAPDAIFLRWKDGVYAVDADKEFDSANVLSLMGRYMEKLLTLDTDTFEKYRVGKSHQILEQQGENGERPEAYHYSRLGDFVLRSQLDAHDSRLPGTGTFDLKTRAVVPIRMDAQDYEWGMDYEIKNLQGEWESFEREYHDMVRSTMLKYSLQVRMGRMDGIFVAFHNIARIFGFQYIGLDEMDKALHGQDDPALGDQEFFASLLLMNKIFDKATKQFPEQTLRFHFETRETAEPFMYIVAEPVSEVEVDAIQTKTKSKVEEWERKLLGQSLSGAHNNGRPKTGVIDEHEDLSSSESSDMIPRAKESQEDELAKLARLNVEEDITSELLEGSTSSESQPRVAAKALEKEYPGMRSARRAADSLVNESPLDQYGEHLESRSETSASQSEETESGTARDDAERIDNTETSADGKFIESVLPEHPEKRILGMVLSVRSVVNGKVTERPSNPFTSHDHWGINYSLGEITKPSRAWSIYDAMRARREKELAFVEDKEEHEDYFRKKLRALAQKGREWRQALEAREAAQGKTDAVRMWNEESSSSPLGNSSGVAARQAQRDVPGPQSSDMSEHERHAQLRRLVSSAISQARKGLRNQTEVLAALERAVAQRVNIDETYPTLAVKELEEARSDISSPDKLEKLAANYLAKTIAKHAEDEWKEQRQVSEWKTAPPQTPAHEVPRNLLHMESESAQQSMKAQR